MIIAQSFAYVKQYLTSVWKPWTKIYPNMVLDPVQHFFKVLKNRLEKTFFLPIFDFFLNFDLK